MKLVYYVAAGRAGVIGAVMKKLALLVGFSLLTLAQPAVAQQAANPIPNPSFENVGDRDPAGWFRSEWGGRGELTTAQPGRSGTRCVGISSTDGADISWSCEVPVEMNSRYRLSGWIKTEGVTVRGHGRGALLNLHNIQAVRTDALVGTNEWTRVEVEFDSGLNETVTLNCLFGGWGLAEGRAWYDDLEITLLKRGETPAPFISIDAGVVGEPISKYVYGQFIEHLGRCIYGGIWAEMLEDRKFFAPVNDAASPWRTVGAASVAMEKDGAFVGEHTPRITLAGDGAPGGIAQQGLQLTSGKSYVGHVWLAGDPSAAPVTVSLVFDDASPLRRIDQTVESLSGEFARADLVFAGRYATTPARIEITSRGKGAFRVGTVSLMPADNVDGFRADTLALLRRLDAPVYRWPGGNFVSGYDWRDGVGDRDRRPPRKNPAWSGVEHNDVGIHEFMRFCELVGTEPYVVVNAGLGSRENAVAELEYINGAAGSPMGQLRERHGRAAPWGVKWWGVGNEMYGGWQLGNVPLTQYVERHNEFVDAMRGVDPEIRVIGVGAAGEWSRTMLANCADRLTLLSEHVYWQGTPGRQGLLSHVKQAPDSLRRIADAHRQYRATIPSLKTHDIRICQDEWNYWYGPDIFGELGTRYFMKDALGCAAALHEFGRSSDLFFMANYAQTVNVIGAIKTSKTNAAMECTGLVLELYRHHLGVLPCKTETSPLVDAIGAWSADRSEFTIAVVNPSTLPAAIPLTLKGVSLTGAGTRRVIANPDPMAHNDPDGESPIVIRTERIEGFDGTLEVGACSVTLLSFDVRRP